MKVDLLNNNIISDHHHKRNPRSAEEDPSEEIDSFKDARSSENAGLKKNKVVKHVFKTRKHGDNKKKQAISEIVKNAGIVKETIALDVEEEKASGKFIKIKSVTTSCSLLSPLLMYTYI